MSLLRLGGRTFKNCIVKYLKSAHVRYILKISDQMLQEPAWIYSKDPQLWDFLLKGVLHDLVNPLTDDGLYTQ